MVVVGALLLIIGVVIVCIVAVVACKIFAKEASRRESAETVAIPMQMTASTDDDAVDVAAKDEEDRAAATADTEASNSNVYTELQQPLTPIAGAVDDVDDEDISSEPFAMY